MIYTAAHCACWTQREEKLLTGAHKSPFIPAYWQNTPQNKNWHFLTKWLGIQSKTFTLCNMPNKFHIFPKRQNLDTIPLPSITINMEMEKDWLIYHVHSDNCSSFSPPTSSWPWSTTDTWKTHWFMDRVKGIFLRCALILLFACAVIVELTLQSPYMGMEFKNCFFVELKWIKRKTSMLLLE